MTQSPHLLERFQVGALSLSLSLLAILCVGGIEWLGLGRLERTMQMDMKNRLDSMIHASEGGLDIWIEGKKRDVVAWARNDQVREAIMGLTQRLQEGAAKIDLLHTEELARLRAILGPMVVEKTHVGFVVFDSSGWQIAALLDQPVGQRTLTQRSDFVERTLGGEVVVSRPFPAEVDIPNLEGEIQPDEPTMFAAAPVRDHSGAIIGVLGFRLRPNLGFTQVFEAGQFGETGETYVVSREGVMLSNSRFTHHLREIGVQPAVATTSILSLQIRDPGGSLVEGFQPRTIREELPLTQMAASIVSGIDGHNVEGYRNYLGVPVVGSWRWLGRYEFGIATEINREEAFAPLNVVRGIVYQMLGLLLFAVCLGGVLSIRQQQIRRKTLDLESAQRETLQFTYDMMNMLKDGIVTMQADGTIESLNQAAIRIFGYQEEEVVGRNVSLLMPSSVEKGHDGDSLNVREKEATQIIDQDGEVVGIRKDGTPFPIDLGVTEVTVKGEPRFAWQVRDITERKQWETEVQNLSKRLLLSTQSAKIGIWDWDISNDNLIWDDQMYCLYGLEKSSSSQMYETWKLAVHPKDKARNREEIQSALNGTKTFDTEFRVLWPDGTTHWIEAHGLVQRDLDAQPVRMIGVNWDITERKQAESELKESQQRLELAIRGTNDGIWDWMDVTQEEEWWSPQFYELLGYQHGEIPSTLETFRRLLHPDDRERVLAAVQQHFQSRVPFDLEYRLQTKAGTYTWFRGRGHTIWDAKGTPVRMAGSIQDISYRKHSEEAIKKLLTEKQLLLDSVGEGIYGLDVTGRVTFLNPSAESMLGFSSEELMGVEIHEIIHHQGSEGESYSMGDCPMCAVLLTAKPDFVMDEVFWRKDGSSFPVESTSMPLFEGDSLVGAVVTFRDITLRQKAEEELRLHKDHLQELVEQRTFELSMAKEIAECANRAKSEFLANMSHELRTPMHAILSFSGMALEKLESAPLEKLSHYLIRVRESGDRLVVLVNNLLDLSKLESGRVAWSLKEEDLGTIVKRVSADCEILIANKGLTFNLVEPSDCPSVECDSEKIFQVVLNLLSNAIKFTPPGKAITISLVPAFVQKGRRRTDLETVPAVALKVEDEGPGIPEEELAAVFDKFFQSNRTKTGAGGTGLGLAICREIVDAHGGRIWAENREHGGAMFTLSLPIRSPQRLNKEEEPHEGQPTVLAAGR